MLQKCNVTIYKKKKYLLKLNVGIHFETALEETILCSIQNTTSEIFLHRNRIKNGTKITRTALYL